MIAMMRNNPARKTLLKVTLSIMTTITTVLLGERQSRRTGQILPLSLYKLQVFRVFFVPHGVDASSLFGLHDHILVSAVMLVFFKNSCVLLSFQRYSIKFFHIGLRVSLLVHAFFDFARQ